MAIVIVGAGVVSPIGVGMPAFSKALLQGECAIRRELLPGFEAEIPLARADCDTPHGEDRTLGFLRVCLREIEPLLRSFHRVIPPEERAVFAATSKGAILSEWESPGWARQHFLELWAGDVARLLAVETDSRGPMGSLVGACATGLGNLIRAARALDSGDCRIALVGASEATLHPAYLASFLNLKAYSPSGCRPFDAAHNGFVAGEGAAVLVVTTQAEAEALGVPVLAEVCGWAEGADAFHPVAMDASGESIKAVGRKAWRRSGCPRVVGVSCHGTGTVGNDTAEAVALQHLWREGMFSQSPVCHSLKGATGHLMGAAGLVEIASALVFLQERRIAPTGGLREQSVDSTGLNFPRETLSLPELEYLLKWSFGFGGSIASVILRRGSRV
ncbi:MAG: beta-ketoacyl synthase N-terminal-like domain-containing protein [Candidatus Sumerlaeia bacterium]|nr:beta-ketoacyl synthase N-terminal-like domain-containing protein [Candidatus Sumerlaeia bacterium]